MNKCPKKVPKIKQFLCGLKYCENEQSLKIWESYDKVQEEQFEEVMKNTLPKIVKTAV